MQFNNSTSISFQEKIKSWYFFPFLFNRTRYILQNSETYSCQVCDSANKKIYRRKETVSVGRQKSAHAPKFTTQVEHTDLNASAGVHKGPGETNEANRSASVWLPSCHQPGRRHTKADSPVFQMMITWNVSICAKMSHCQEVKFCVDRSQRLKMKKNNHKVRKSDRLCHWWFRRLARLLTLLLAFS